MKTRIQHLLFLSTFCLGFLTAEVGFGASGLAGKEEGDAGARPVRGTDRIENAGEYTYWTRGAEGPTMPAYGYKVICAERTTQPGKEFQREHLNIRKEYNSSYPEGFYTPREGLHRGTLVDDIRGAMLDQNEFDVALMESRFFEAWSMGGETRQGNLWKRLAMGSLKKHLTSLLERAVYGGNESKMRAVRVLIDPFPAEVKGVLEAYVASEKTDMERILENLGREQAAKLTALRALAARLSD